MMALDFGEITVKEELKSMADQNFIGYPRSKKRRLYSKSGTA